MDIVLVKVHEKNALFTGRLRTFMFLFLHTTEGSVVIHTNRLHFMIFFM
ncbi:hypothetical protein US8_03799 [Bacillus altitudinis]|nr:hypothetical protein US8_03799 [Bacillus altitudinis]